MTIKKTLLTKGYFPKELPPSFETHRFARYATSRSGRGTISKYKPANNLTECVNFALALPGRHDQRLLKIPHPYGFAMLVDEVVGAFPRLLKKAGVSKLSRSRPVYSTTDHRAVRTLVAPANLSRERTLTRATGSFLLRADVNQFYPGLYTHAVGWAIDPKLRNKANWRNTGLLGKRIDQLLMNMQGKVSQGIPTGNDLSFLLAEIVLCNVDQALSQSAARAFRWFDDYEIVCDSREEAETVLADLRTALARFNLRLNPSKTSISELPRPTGDSWQHELADASRTAARDHRSMVRFFDTAFDLRSKHSGAPVLLYAMGLLFKFASPARDILRVAQSCITQAILSEPGSAQKGFSLLTYWALNGSKVAMGDISEAVEKMLVRHEKVGATSDISWALYYCLTQRVLLTKKTGKILSTLEDDCVAIQALDAQASGIMPHGFSSAKIATTLRKATLDSEHWLAFYESVRHGFLPALTSYVSSDPFFGDMLANDVSFYRRTTPRYAAVIHPGGAPSWVVRAWLTHVTPPPFEGEVRTPAPTGTVATDISADAEKLGRSNSFAEAIQKLLAALDANGPPDDDEVGPYG